MVKLGGRGVEVENEYNYIWADVGARPGKDSGI